MRLQEPLPLPKPLLFLRHFLPLTLLQILRLFAVESSVAFKPFTAFQTFAVIESVTVSRATVKSFAISKTFINFFPGTVSSALVTFSLFSVAYTASSFVSVFVPAQTSSSQLAVEHTNGDSKMKIGSAVFLWCCCLYNLILNLNKIFTLFCKIY